MIKSICIFSFVMLSGFFLAQNTAMSGAEAKAFVSRISAEAKEIKTLQADFIQTKKMDFLAHVHIVTYPNFNGLVCQDN